MLEVGEIEQRKEKSKGIVPPREKHSDGVRSQDEGTLEIMNRDHARIVLKPSTAMELLL